MKSFILTALATLAAAQLQDPSFKGPGHIYVVQGQIWPWGPDDPSASTLGCLNSAGKLVASGCAVFNANVTTIRSAKTGGDCGWTIRKGAGAQPGVFNCASPTYYGLYRLVSRLIFTFSI